MRALVEAQEWKQRFQKILSDELTDFTTKTGLVVQEIEVERIEVTKIGDAGRIYQYRAHARIEVE